MSGSHHERTMDMLQWGCVCVCVGSVYHSYMHVRLKKKRKASIFLVAKFTQRIYLCYSSGTGLIRTRTRCMHAPGVIRDYTLAAHSHFDN